MAEGTGSDKEDGTMQKFTISKEIETRTNSLSSVVEISIITINIQSHTNYINLVYIIITLEGTVYILPVTKNKSLSLF